ncbi:VOC family protein [Rhizobium sp. RCC_161_2]|uniref:VOC family protein n=1 Tax=Rhizobium sp. RCC_161_2 TaxID=3239219 RepID=UPI00352425A2
MKLLSTPNRRTFLASLAGALSAMIADGNIDNARANAQQNDEIIAHRRPMFIKAAGLLVHNLEGMILFYQQVIGLKIMNRYQGGALLGIGGAGLIELVRTTRAASSPPTATAGLYHLAFVMPTRRDLARWIVHAARNHFQVSGLADHRVTESVYLNDPEGNGIEVYAERPVDQWHWSGDQVDMGVFDLDVGDLLKLTDREKDDYSNAPDAMRIGHIHLKVGELTAAETFYAGLVGLDVTRRAPGVVFMSSGKYHHHVAANVWESQGAGKRDEGELGLAWFEIAVTDPSLLKEQKRRLRTADIALKTFSNGLEVADPWGNLVRLIQI